MNARLQVSLVIGDEDAGSEILEYPRVSDIPVAIARLLQRAQTEARQSVYTFQIDVQPIDQDMSLATGAVANGTAANGPAANGPSANRSRGNKSGAISRRARCELAV